MRPLHPQCELRRLLTRVRKSVYDDMTLPPLNVTYQLGAQIEIEAKPVQRFVRQICAGSQLVMVNGTPLVDLLEEACTVCRRIDGLLVTGGVVKANFEEVIGELPTPAEDVQDGLRCCLYDIMIEFQRIDELLKQIDRYFNRGPRIENFTQS